MSLGFCQTGCYTTLRIQLLLMQEVLQCRKSDFDKGFIGLENPQKKSHFTTLPTSLYVDYFLKKGCKMRLWGWFSTMMKGFA